VEEREAQAASTELANKLRAEYHHKGWVTVGLSFGHVIKFIVYHEGRVPPKAPATWKGCPVEVRYTGPIRPLADSPTTSEG